MRKFMFAETETAAGFVELDGLAYPKKVRTMKPMWLSGYDDVQRAVEAAANSKLRTVTYTSDQDTTVTIKIRTKTPTEIYAQGRRVSQRANDLGRLRARLADPATDGIPNLVSNWGNEESRRAWKIAESRSSKALAIASRLYDLADHTQRHGPHFRPLWCAFCVNRDRDREE